MFVAVAIVALAVGTAGCTAWRRPVTGPATGGQRYLFRDEFNGTALDLSKWQPNWLGRDNTTITKPVNSAELSCYSPAQVRVPGDGYLHLRAVQQQCRGNDGRTYAYASGLVQTFSSFRFTNGRLEARVYVPGTDAIANWPAVWTNGTGTWPSTGESDVMEGLSGKACYHYHSPSGGPGACASGTHTGWHRYAEEVRNGVTTYYYDGVKVGSVRSMNAQHYLILNYGVGGWGGPISTPSEMLVDWVRVTP
jgi:beta-glucanase (GH16 family)